MKCTILDDYQNVATKVADWSILDSKVQVKTLQEHYSDPEALIDEIIYQDILVVMRERTIFNTALLSRLPNLKLIVTSGMRNASIDLDYANEKGITVCGTNSLSEPAIELTWALLLGLARNIQKENQELKNNGPWQSTLGVGLNGKQLGIIGLGKIGAQVAKIGKAFGMNVVAWSQNLTKEKADAENVILAPSKELLLESSDFVSVHLLLSERTKNIISAPDLALMRPSAYLINTSRAPIVNEIDLIRALKEKQIAGAGIDVFDFEPLNSDHPFRTLTNVLATPHIGYVTKENYKIYFTEAIENINAFLSNSPLRQLTTAYNKNCMSNMNQH